MKLQWQMVILQMDIVTELLILICFFSHVPNDGGFAIMAGVQQLIEYFDHLHFSEEDIALFEHLHNYSLLIF